MYLTQIVFLNVVCFLVLANVIKIKSSQDIFYWRHKSWNTRYISKKISLVNVSHLNLLVFVSVLSLTHAAEFRFYVDIRNDVPNAIILN
jgi:hypothetical protein